MTNKQLLLFDKIMKIVKEEFEKAVIEKEKLSSKTHLYHYWEGYSGAFMNLCYWLDGMRPTKKETRRIKK